jgi:hypothetical protein
VVYVRLIAEKCQTPPSLQRYQKDVNHDEADHVFELFEYIMIGFCPKLSITVQKYQLH